MDWIKRSNTTERGQSLIVLVFGMAFLAGMVTLVIDVGLFFQERRHIQNAADAAALAGAPDLCSSPGAAVALANEWAQNNDIGSKSGDTFNTQTSQTGGVSAIEVTVKRDVPFYFAPVLGIDSADVKARARASASCKGWLRPWGLFEAEITLLTPGTQFTLRQGALAGVGGNFQTLAIDGPGTATYVDTVKYASLNALCAEYNILIPLIQGDEGYEYPSADCPSTVNTQTGVAAQATLNAVEWIIDHTSAPCDTFDEVFETTLDDVTQLEVFNIKPQCSPFPPYNVVASRRVIIVPIIEDSILSGQTEVTVVGFAVMWLEEISCLGPGVGQCEVAATLVDLMARVPWYRSARLTE